MSFFSVALVYCQWVEAEIVVRLRWRIVVDVSRKGIGAGSSKGVKRVPSASLHQRPGFFLQCYETANLAFDDGKLLVGETK